MRGDIGIDGREYKLLLDPVHFKGPFEESASGFWADPLKPLILKTLDDQDRAKGALRLKKRREVVFFDTGDGALAQRGFALRRRTLVQEDGTGVPEWTLKFRTPDFLLAAEYCRLAEAELPDDTKLEEDIAPLQVSRGGKLPVAVPTPRSVYSRFSVSTKLSFPEPLQTLGEAFARFGMLQAALRSAAGRSAMLKPGATIAEWVFQDAMVDLGKDLDAEFGFTFWRLFPEKTQSIPWKRLEGGAAAKPTVAEISFDFDTKDGRMDSSAAERASTLFIAMQGNLRVNTKATSKTALGLPPTE